MRKFLRLTLVCLMAMVCSSAFADAYKILTFPDGNKTKTNQYTVTWNATINGDTWEITNFSNNNNAWNFIRCGRRSSISTASIATDFAIDQPISSVVVTFDKIEKASKINSISLVVASDADFSNVVETIDMPVVEIDEDLTDGHDKEFKIANPAANYYYKLVVDCQIAGDNGIVQISKVAYYKSGDEPDIFDIANTPETAYTVAKANELIAAGKGLTTKVYVKGVITKIDDVSTDYGKATYYINDTEDTEGQLYIYRGYYLNGDKFTLKDQIKVGDNVIVYGQLTIYKETYEMAEGNYIHSIETVPTGITDVAVEKEFDENAPIYNLSGQRVDKNAKGILIQNGKKFIRR